MKKIVTSITLLIMVIVGYVAAGPFITIHQIKIGMEKNDSKHLSDYIDFYMLHTNLKNQLNTLVIQQIATELKESPSTAMAMYVPPEIIESTVVSLTTPAGLKTLMGGNLPQKGGGSAAASISKRMPLEHSSYTYDSPNKFSILVKTDDGKDIRFVLTRNWISWKLTDITFPKDAQ